MKQQGQDQHLQHRWTKNAVKGSVCKMKVWHRCGTDVAVLQSARTLSLEGNELHCLQQL